MNLTTVDTRMEAALLGVVRHGEGADGEESESLESRKLHLGTCVWEGYLGLMFWVFWRCVSELVMENENRVVLSGGFI